MEIRLLGPLEVRIDGREVALGGPKVRALLAVLLLNANRTVAVEALIDALWGDEPPGSARQTVHYFVHRLRRALGEAGDRLVTSASGYELHVAPGELDVDTFEQLAAEARAMAAGGDLEAAAATLERAAALWRGRPLGDLMSAPFAEAEAARLEALHATAMEERFEIGLQLGRHTQLVAELEAMTAAHPFRERPRAQLMLALYRSGRRAEALAAFAAARRTFSHELGIEPGPQLQKLERAILTSDPAIELPRARPAAAAPAPAPVTRPEPLAEAPAPPPARPRRVTGEERKVVTVLVAGLVRSEAAALDPEDAHRRLTGALARIRGQVEKFGGTVQAVLGATAFAVFGVPTAHDDDQERAVRAALALAAPGEPDADGLAVRAGVDTGEAMVTPPGDAGPSVVGEVVDRAATLSTLAAAGEILVSPAVARATRATMELVPAPPGRVPDGTEQVRGTRSRTGAGGRPAGLSPLVERDPELALLRGLLGRVRLSHDPQLVTIVGSPGVGKSRLIRELGELVDADPELVSWRQGRSLAYGDAITFDALAELVKAHAGILEDDPAEVAEAKLGAAVADAGEGTAAAWMERHLLPLVAPGPSGDSGTSPRTEAFTAWRRFLEALAAQRPLVLVFEDLHWADDALLDFIDELADRAGPVPLMIVCAGRPELLDRRPGWGGGKRNATTLSLAPLTPAGTNELLAALLHGEPLPPETLVALREAAGGNPLFVEEYVRMLHDLDLVPGEAPGTAGRSLPVPVSVSQLITARLDTLPPEDKALLKDAAALGERGWIGALVTISGQDRDELEAWLRRLERRELLGRVQPSAVANETEFAFRHVLVQEVAYGQLPRAERAERHDRAATWLESLGDRATDRAELLAHHYARALAYTRAAGRDTAGLAARARPALRMAGDRAASLNAPDTAARFYAAALELTPPDDAGQAELLLRLGEAQWRGQGTGRAALEQASTALLAAGRQAEAADAERMLSLLATVSGRGEDSAAHSRRALELIRDQPPSRPKAAVLAHFARHLISYEARYAEAVETGRAALAIAADLGLRDLEGYALQWISRARILAGDLGGFEDGRRAVATLEEVRSFQAALAGSSLAADHAALGDVAQASAVIEAAKLAAERFGAPPDDRRTVEMNWGVACYWTGRWDAATALLDRLFTELASGSECTMEPMLRLDRGRLELARGDLDAALEDSRRSVEGATESGLARQVQALCFRARVLLAAGRLPEAIPLVEELLGDLDGEILESGYGSELPIVIEAAAAATGRDALVLLDEAGPLPSLWLDAARAWVAGDYTDAAKVYAVIGARPDEAAARMAAGRALLDAGQPAEAAAELEAARAFWAEVGATGYLRETRAMLAEAAAAR